MEISRKTSAIHTVTKPFHKCLQQTLLLEGTYLQTGHKYIRHVYKANLPKVRWFFSAHEFSAQK